MRIKNVYNRVLKSPEINSWLLHIVKAIQILLVYPLIFQYLPVGESAMWMILMLFVTLQNLFDLGFQNVFIRILSQANTGNWFIPEKNYKVESNKTQKTNSLILRIDKTIRFVYIVLSTIFLLIVLTFGSIYVFSRKTHLSLEDFSSGFWGLFVIGLSLSFYNRRYGSYLIGLQYISLVRRTEAVVNLFSLVTSLSVLLIFQTLSSLILNYTFWQIVLSLTFRSLYIKKRLLNNVTIAIDREVLVFVWPMAWKGTISSLSSYGLVNAFALWFSSFSIAGQIVSFNYALKILDSIRLFSRVPFYSNIPKMNALRVSVPYKFFAKNTLMNTQRSNVIFLLLSIGFYMIGFDLIRIYSPSFSMVQDSVWLLLCLSYYIHLNGAFHTHIFSMSNKVNSHISDFISGVLILSFLFLFFNQNNLLLFPIALITGYGLFYLPWSLFYSKKVLSKNFLKFVVFSMILPLLLCLILTTELI